MSGKMTFRGYVNYLSKKYQRSESEKPFMTIQTFIEWFFAWSSRMEIDFRQQCQGCSGPPKILACDGTKIGIGFKNMAVKPIETPDETSPMIKTPHRRLNRCFIPNKKDNQGFANARQWLKNVSEIVMSGKSLDNHTASITVPLLVNYLPQKSKTAFNRMIYDDISEDVRWCYARLFNLLSYDSALDSIIPFGIAEKCIEFSNLIEQNSFDIGDVAAFSNYLKNFCPEMAELISVSIDSEGVCPMDVFSLLKHCAEFVLQYHALDIKAEEANPIPMSYNPPKNGRAYYFHPHGCQIRKVRPFSVDKTSTTTPKLYDDLPETVCNKKYPQVSKKGISYLFLWFCPQHGHCYGYHIIPESEGRKDAAISLYTHLEVAPDVIIYDFSCNLSEYAQNRESGYFKTTRFFLDVFHGFTHTCSPAFRANRIKSLDVVNTSICEQFNSFLQNIKTSAKLMSQQHFTFYVQFFVHIWNQQKREQLERKMEIAQLSRE